MRSTSTRFSNPATIRPKPTRLLHTTPHLCTVNDRSRTKFKSYAIARACSRSACSQSFIPGTLPIEPQRSNTPSYDAHFIGSMFPRLASIASLSSNTMQAATMFLRFNEIRLTDPSSQANGMLSARIDTRIKLHISFQPSSQVQFLRIPKTPSVHDDRPEPEQALRFSLELRGAAGGAIIGNVCSKCKERKGQATWDIVDFRAPTTIITIENGTATIEFFIKCYPQHHGLDPCGFCVDAILLDRQDNVIDRTQLPLLFNISGKGKPPVRLKKAQRRALRGLSALPQSFGFLPSIDYSAQNLQHIQNMNGGVPTDPLETLAGGVQQTNYGDAHWSDSTIRVLPPADPVPWYLFPALDDIPAPSMNDSQPLVHSQLGVNSQNIGDLAPVPMESDIGPEMVHSRTRANAQPDMEQILPVTPLDVAPVPQSLGSTSSRPQGCRSVNQASGVPEATIRVLSESSSGTSGGPNTPSALPSGQGSSAPYITIPSETSRSQIEAPARTCNEGINQTADETFLEEVVPEKGPMIGGIRIVILGENFPAVPLYVGFGNNWVRVKRRDACTLRCPLPPSSQAGVVKVTLSRTPLGDAPEVGWSNATFKYEDTRIEALLSILKCVYDKADESTIQTALAQSFATMNTHLDRNLTTNATHSTHQEGEKTSQKSGEVNLEEVSIRFLYTYSTNTNWRQTVSSCNDHCQTMAHISVTLGYFRLLQYLFTWGINLNAVDHMGLTALHYSYLFNQEACTRFLIHSGADQFILDDLGRSPFSLAPSLEVTTHSTIDADGSSSVDHASPIECNIDVPEAEKLYAKHFLVQQWMEKVGDERRDEATPSRYQCPDGVGLRKGDVTSPKIDSAGERSQGLLHVRSLPSKTRFTPFTPTLVTGQEIETPTKRTVPSDIPSSLALHKSTEAFHLHSRTQPVHAVTEADAKSRSLVEDYWESLREVSQGVALIANRRRLSQLVHKSVELLGFKPGLDAPFQALIVEPSQSIRPPPIGGGRSRPKPMLGLAIAGDSAAVGGIGANDPDAGDEAGAADDVDGGGITIPPHNPQPAGVESSLDDLNKVLTPRSASNQGSAVPTSPPSADEIDWTEAENYLEDVGRLGEGAGGEVFQVRDKRTNKILARKIIKARSTPPKQLVRELNALSTTKNENIIRVYGAYASPSNSEVKVIMELCEGGSLEAISERIKRLGKRPSEKLVGKIGEGIFHGLAYLHSKRIIHRSIKPSNILLSRTGVIKLCDFGVSGELVDSITSTWTGTSLYMAPDRIAGWTYTIQSDVWSSGLTLLTFAQGRFPYPGDLDGTIELVSFLQRTEPAKLMDEEPRDDGTGGVQWSPAMKDFIALCLTKDGQTRPTPEECLQQSWLVESSQHKVNMPQWIRDVWGWDNPRGRTQLAQRVFVDQVQ